MISETTSLTTSVLAWDSNRSFSCSSSDFSTTSLTSSDFSSLSFFSSSSSCFYSSPWFAFSASYFSLASASISAYILAFSAASYSSLSFSAASASNLIFSAASASAYNFSSSIQTGCSVWSTLSGCKPYASFLMFIFPANLSPTKYTRPSPVTTAVERRHVLIFLIFCYSFKATGS